METIENNILEDKTLWIEERFRIIQEQTLIINQLKEQLAKAEDIKKTCVAELEKHVNETQVPLESASSRVRLVKGLTQTKWNEEKLKELCPEDIKKLIFIVKQEEKLDTKMVNFLHKQNKLAKDVIDSCLTINPAIVYAKFESKQ